jgi:hypothetical protein
MYNEKKIGEAEGLDDEDCIYMIGNINIKVDGWLSVLCENGKEVGS